MFIRFDPRSSRCRARYLYSPEASGCVLAPAPSAAVCAPECAVLRAAHRPRTSASFPAMGSVFSFTRLHLSEKSRKGSAYQSPSARCFDGNCCLPLNFIHRGHPVSAYVVCYHLPATIIGMYQTVRPSITALGVMVLLCRGPKGMIDVALLASSTSRSAAAQIISGKGLLVRRRSELRRLLAVQDSISCHSSARSPKALMSALASSGSSQAFLKKYHNQGALIFNGALVQVLSLNIALKHHRALARPPHRSLQCSLRSAATDLVIRTTRCPRRSFKRSGEG